uniref:Zinc finger ZPR1-type domain-containing protein n=1 Tax=Entomoneis paludosa TaxID=265537 RepID=A0A7S3DST4_9STRA|mmetsp:Transcript_34481/g.71809  ORF Transcript_34481/g.71809 Transcript_34481/m.71809 type:complete len:524 (+) Transcript_34481:60-1631(+)
MTTTSLHPPSSNDPEGCSSSQPDDLTIVPECYCPACGGGRGVTTVLPTILPTFGEIMVMTLLCDDCGWRDSQVTASGEIQRQGQILTLTVASPRDLNRQVVKSDAATLSVPQLDLEIPPSTQRGTLSTVEGILKKTATALESQQPDRLRLGDVENFHRCRNVIQRLRRYAGVENDDDSDNENDKEALADVFPFTIILDDPAGNSFIENPLAPHSDPLLKSQHYFRTPTQDMALGLQPSQAARQQGIIDDSNPLHKNPVNSAPDSHSFQVLSSTKNETEESMDTNIGRHEALVFPSSCPHCHQPTETKMCVTDIPHFPEVILMSLTCHDCGYKSNEIKGGGAIPRHGCRVSVTVQSVADLTRHVLKSDTAGITIPELELELGEGGLEGVYSTIEGLLQKMHQRLQLAHPLLGRGDSAIQQHTTNNGGEFSPPSSSQVRFQTVLTKLQQMARGEILPFTFILSDPLGHSFVGPPGPNDGLLLDEKSQECAKEDPGILVEGYERTHDQNEALGLNDIQTENYQKGK